VSVQIPGWYLDHVPTLNLEQRPTRLLTMPDGADIAVWDSGEEDRPAAAFVHGFPENRLCWAPVLDSLQPRDSELRCVVYDLRGFGESAKTGEASWQQFVADHLELTRQLGLDRYHLVGHDWGAAIALHLARLAPETLLSATVLNTTFWKIDVLGMWHLWLMNLPLVPGYLFGRRSDWFFEKTMVASFNDPSRLPAASRASYLEMFRDREITRFWIALYRQTVRFMLRSALPRPLRGNLGASRVDLPRPSDRAFQVPTQLIWGADDTFCPLWVGRAIESRLRESGATVEFHEIADSGHFVTEERPDEVSRLLIEWLPRHRTTT
jgi:pimeloyl-ACP methyl ester carboxylesterase